MMIDGAAEKDESDCGRKYQFICASGCLCREHAVRDVQCRRQGSTEMMYMCGLLTTCIIGSDCAMRMWSCMVESSQGIPRILYP